MGLHSEAQLDRRYIEMVRLLNVYLNHFPRSEKYGLSTPAAPRRGGT